MFSIPKMFENSIKRYDDFSADWPSSQRKRDISHKSSLSLVVNMYAYIHSWNVNESDCYKNIVIDFDLLAQLTHRSDDLQILGCCSEYAEPRMN